MEASQVRSRPHGFVRTGSDRTWGSDIRPRVAVAIAAPKSGVSEDSRSHVELAGDASGDRLLSDKRAVGQDSGKTSVITFLHSAMCRSGFETQ